MTLQTKSNPAKLHDILNDRLPKLESLLREAGYGIHDVRELLRLFAGFYTVKSLLAGGDGFDRDMVNLALRTHVGSGHSWYSSLKYLTGKRAQEIFVARTDVIREIGGSDLVRAFNGILPQACDLVDGL